MALFRTGMNYCYKIFSRQSSSFILEAHYSKPSVLRRWQSKKKKRPAWTKLLTTDQLHTFKTGKQGREDNNNFYSPWARHVVLFNIYQFQLFECLYKNDSLFDCLHFIVSYLHGYSIVHSDNY